MPQTQAFVALTFGEILVDDLPAGARLGGGPFNTASHLAARGFDVAQISAVGRDSLGDDLIARAKSLDVDASLIQRSDLPTSRVVVSLNAQGEASYKILRPVAWDRISFKQASGISEGQISLSAKRAASASLLAIWLLGVRSDTSFDALEWVLAKADSGCLVAVDFGLRPPHFSKERIEALLNYAHIAKMNEEEFETICDMLGIIPNLEVLAKAYKLDSVVVTRGANGAKSWTVVDSDNAEGKLTVVAAAETGKIVDTVGCGDAFFAGYLAARVSGECELNCLQAGVNLGAYATSYAGGLPPVKA